MILGDVANEYLRAVVGQRFGDGAPDAGPPGGDHGAPAVAIDIHR